MPSYLVTIRIEAETERAARTVMDDMSDHYPAEAPPLVSLVYGDEVNRITYLYETGDSLHVSLPSGHLTTDEPPPEASAAVRALSPAVVEELRREWRVDARNEAMQVVRQFVLDACRYRIP